MTTTQAFRQLIRCHAIIAVNIWNAINFFVTKRSWFALALIILIGSAASSIVSCPHVPSAIVHSKHKQSCNSRLNNSK